MCDVCKKKSLKIQISDKNGLCSKVALFCEECSNSLGVTYTSPRVDCSPNKQAPFIINRRAVESAISVGIGNAGLEDFCTNLNVRPMSSRTFRLHATALSVESVKLQEKVLTEAGSSVRKFYSTPVHVPHKDILDISVSYDGTWHKRGHKSLYGVGIIIDTMTGLVLDFEILSKFCHSCAVTAAELGADSPEYHIWLEGHKSECSINFTGPSGNMEVYAAELMWSRSVAKHGLRYTTMLSDGDSRAWNQLNKIAPYGEDVPILKEECINHVHKRMGTALRNIVKKEKLGGRKEGSLTANKIELLCKYYKRAIISNKNDVDSMKRAIKASLYHCSSTNEAPRHEFCPIGVTSWCFFNQAVAANEVPPSHSKKKLWLNKIVFENLVPIYERLSDSELLQRCTRGATQNRNESLHSLIWRKCAKEKFVSKNRIHAAVIQSVMEKNCGIYNSEKIKAKLTTKSLSMIQKAASKKKDGIRIKRKIKQEEYRQSKRHKESLDRKKREEKSADYQPGAY